MFTSVLEAAYAKMREAEQELRLDVLEPELAIRRLAEFTFDFDNANPDFVRLVLTENIHRGRHMSKSIRAKEMTGPIIDQIRRMIDRGVEKGVFRTGINPVELHMTLSALCFFSVGNRHTFEPQFGYDMSSKNARTKRRQEIADIMWRYARAENATGTRSTPTRKRETVRGSPKSG